MRYNKKRHHFPEDALVHFEGLHHSRVFFFFFLGESAKGSYRNDLFFSKKKISKKKKKKVVGYERIVVLLQSFHILFYFPHLSSRGESQLTNYHKKKKFSFCRFMSYLRNKTAKE